MKIAPLSLLLFLFMAPLANAQEFEQDVTKSFEQAHANDKLVLMVFSGSDWCKPCIQLRTSIIGSAEFVKFSEEKLVLLEVDFPYRKKNQLSAQQTAHNEKLAEQYNPEGSFPKVILFDADQHVLGEIKYSKKTTPQEFMDQITALLHS
jgi:thioredoxin-related protein